MTDKKHTAETIFVKVFCKDRQLMRVAESYITNIGVATFFGDNAWAGIAQDTPEWWLEEIPNPLAGIDNPAEWVKQMKLVDVCLILQTKEQLLSDILSERDKLQAENERLKKEIAEWELFSKAANESIEERNETIAQLREKLGRMGGLSSSEKGLCRICGGDSCDSDSHN